MSAPVDSLPEVAFDPLQLPLAVHEFVLLLLQVNVVEPLKARELLPALNDNAGCGEGGGSAATLTLTVRDTDPPPPWQVSVNVLLLAKGAVDSLPVKGRAPDQSPLAKQEDAFELLQFSEVVPLKGTDKL